MVRIKDTGEQVSVCEGARVCTCGMFRGVTEPYLQIVRDALFLIFGPLSQQIQEVALGPCPLLCSPTDHLALESTETLDKLHIFYPFVSVIKFFFLTEEKEAHAVCAISFFALAYSRLSTQANLHLSLN